MFLDETGSTTTLLRRYGRAPRGARVHAHAPCGRWQTSTFLAAWRVTGLTAPGVFDGRDRWRALPRRHRPDLGADPAPRRHRHRRPTSGPTRSPASSGPSRPPGPPSGTCHPTAPNLNPIELCFAKLKALVRTARCRRTETLWPFLGECLAHFSPDECRNSFRHCGYSAATRS